ncbi:MAG: hypothetical protein ACK5KT_08320 [Dysgonomonas sp.]
MEEIKAGDVVILKSDYNEELKMTVQNVYNNGEYATCFWVAVNSNGSNTVAEGKFPVIVLKKIS